MAHGQESSSWEYDTARLDQISSSAFVTHHGDYSDEYPILLPKGVNELSPDIKLTYSNQNDSIISYLGYGWNLQIPAVSRYPKTGIERLYTDNNFSSTLHGELAETGSNIFRPRVEVGPRHVYERIGDGWVTHDTDGKKYTFGSTTASRIDNPASSTQIFSWLLSEIQDTNGNKIVYEYTKVNGNIYPYKISYAYVGTNPNYEVKFFYASSTITTSFTSGFSIKNDRKLSTIDVLFSGSLVSRYNLEYKSAASSSVQLLTSIQNIGYNPSGSTTSLPPRLFSYNEHTPISWDSDLTIGTTSPTQLYSQVTYSGSSNNYYYRVVLTDMNGDSLADWIADSKVYLNTGAGWEASSSWPTLPVDNLHLENRLVDVNGDLLPDIVTSKKSSWDYRFNTPDSYVKQVYLNNGNGTWTDSISFAQSIPQEFYLQFWTYPGGITSSKSKILFTDINGDGLNDWIDDGYVYLNNGAGWATSSTWAQLPSGSSAFDDKYRMSDVNGDNLPDVIQAEYHTRDYQWSPNTPYGTWKVWLNQGNGNWYESAEWSNAIPRGAECYQDHLAFPPNLQQYYYKCYISDINGDGLADWMRGTTAYLNTGVGWSTTSVVTLPFDTANYEKSYRLVDIDGDDQVDLVKYFKLWWFGAESDDKGAWINNTQRLWQLSTTTNELGGTTVVTYDVSTRKVNGELLNPKNPQIKHVVTKVTKNPLQGSPVIMNYSQEDGSFYFNASATRDRRFAGFGKIISENGPTKTTSYYHQANGIATSTEESIDGWGLIGQPYRTEINSVNDDLFRLIRSNYSTSSLGSGRTAVDLISSVQLDFDGDGDKKATAKEYAYNVANGTVSSLTEWGQVNGNTDGTFSDTGADKRVTQFGYATNTTTYIVGLPATEVVTDQNGTKIRESRYYYDSQSLGAVTKGNRTKEESWISGSLYASSTRSYNSLGLVTAETNPRGKTTTYSYDSYNLYPATSTNPLSQSTRYQYDYSSGKVATTTDPNGEVYVTIYDGLDRPLLERIPDPQSGTLVTKSEYVYTDTAGNVNVKKVNYLNSATTTTEYSYLDGFGRTIQQRIEMEDSNKFSVRDYYYGVNGLLAKESLPYESTGASSTASTSIANLYSTYTYDPLDRVTLVTTAVGETATNYDQWTETVTDALGNEKDYIYDAYERLTQVKEHLGTSTYTTTYVWNGNDNLTKITDALSNVRNITYDALGRRLTLEDLHAVGDASFGSWSFTYDLAGNVSTTTNPKGQIIGRTYDALNRQLTENYTSQAGTEATFSYDSCTKGVGRLCSSLNSNGTTTYAYNRLGQVATDTKAIGTSTYSSRYEYDRQGNQTRVVYPDNSEVTYQYNKAGKLEMARQKESGGAWKNIIANRNYGPHGMVTYQLLGNGASTTKTYDANSLYRLSSILTMATSSFGTGGPGAELALLEEALALEPQFEEAAFEPTPDQEVELLSEILIEEIQPEVTLSEDVSDESLVTAPLEETILVEDPSDPTVLLPTESDIPVIIDEFPVATGTTATNTVTYVEDTASSTTAELIMPIETILELASSTDMIPVLVEELKPKKRDTDKFIKSARDAQLWQRFLKERATGIRESKDAPQEAIVAADYALDQFEGYLVEKGYVDAKGVEVKPSAKDKIQGVLKKVIDKVISFILPESVYAYLFGVEDFESCSSLPCSFSNVVTWGSVTQSLDATSKVTGTDSLKEVVAGEGEGSVESINHNEDEVWVQFKIFVPSSMTWGPSGYFSVLNLEDSSNGNIFWLAIEDWGTPRLTMAGDTLSWTDTGITLTEGAVNTIEVRFKKGASTGDVDIWHNSTNAGSPTYNGSGTMNTGTDNVDDIRIGMTYSPESGISTTYYDNITIDTVFIGEPAPAGTEPFVAKVQDLKYTYDAVGNITTVVDASQTKTAATTSYQYDDLYRLTRASTTKASTTPFVETYTYNAIGNLLTKSDIGTYEYTGSASSEVTQAIYTDSIAAGWSDWSWNSTVNPANTSPVAVGTNSLRVQYNSAWAGLSYRITSLNTAAYESIDLRVNVGTSTNTSLYLYFTDAGGTLIQAVDLEDYIVGDFVANTWHDVSIPLTHLDMETYNAATSFNIESSIAATVYYDQIELVGNSGGSASYANPHAATIINGITYAYDQNGNLATTSAGLLNTWTYDNRLSESRGAGIATTTHTYDTAGTRLTKTSGGVTTKYPFSFYEHTGTSTTKHIYAGGELVATVESATPAPKVYYNHLDHLGGTAAVSTADGYLSQELAYYPFGAMRVDEQYGQIDQSRRYTGHEYDDETNMSYMGARYQSGNEGRFISQDPVAAHTPEVVFKDPQQLNTYTYTRNNPLIGFDPSGLLTVFIHGTFSDQNAFSNEYMESVANDLGDTRYVNYSWSGKNDVQSRAEAAVRLANGFEASNFSDGEKLNIIAHSHGGNVAIQALNIVSLDEDRVGSVILLGTPARSDYQLNKTYSSNNFLNVYSETDGVQTNGGRIQDFGAAGRTRGDGFKNLKATYQQNPGWIDSHSELKSPSVWDGIKSFIGIDN